MASKSAYRGSEKGAEIEELLIELDKLLDRVKVLYEQYFMGMAKVAPMHQHTDLERKFRELTQLSIRNTALRYRFATLTQKFASYQTYWKRTLREIESGRYLRNLSKIKRRAESLGGDIPAEIFAAMPKRMQDQVRRDRELAASQAMRRGESGSYGEKPGLDDDFALEDGVAAAAPTPSPTAKTQRGGVHTLLEGADDFDLDALFAAIGAEDASPLPPARTVPERPKTIAASPPPAPRSPAPPPRPPPPPARAIPRAPATMFTGGATPPPKQSAPDGMTDADVRVLYAQYVKARTLVGAKSDQSTYDKLLKTIKQQAPKIMAQYQAKSVEFGVVIKDNQVVLKAKPKS